MTDLAITIWCRQSNGRASGLAAAGWNDTSAISFDALQVWDMESVPTALPSCHARTHSFTQCVFAFKYFNIDCASLTTKGSGPLFWTRSGSANNFSTYARAQQKEKKKGQNKIKILATFTPQCFIMCMYAYLVIINDDRIAPAALAKT